VKGPTCERIHSSIIYNEEILWFYFKNYFVSRDHEEIKTKIMRKCNALKHYDAAVSSFSFFLYIVNSFIFQIHNLLKIFYFSTSILCCIFFIYFVCTIHIYLKKNKCNGHFLFAHTPWSFICNMKSFLSPIFIILVNVWQTTSFLLKKRKYKIWF